jgi:site-specific DNA-methyltransferase (adenine-specific)
MFKYEWVWIKSKPSNFLMGKKQPMKYHENICVFYKNAPVYNPIMIPKEEKNKRNNKACARLKNESIGVDSNKYENRLKAGQADFIYPRNYLMIGQEYSGLHPTQKPVALFEYLIKTYSNPGETVLDNVMGSGTTGVACKNLGREFIGIEKDENYFKIAFERINGFPYSR